MAPLINCQKCGSGRLIVALTTVRLFVCPSCMTMSHRPQDRDLVIAELEAIALTRADRAITRWLNEMQGDHLYARVA